eukprot:1150692-Pelagomonas_calceolata.AAC.3
MEVRGLSSLSSSRPLAIHGANLQHSYRLTFCSGSPSATSKRPTIQAHYFPSKYHLNALEDERRGGMGGAIGGHR